MSTGGLFRVCAGASAAVAVFALFHVLVPGRERDSDRPEDVPATAPPRRPPPAATLPPVAEETSSAADEAASAAGTVGPTPPRIQATLPPLPDPLWAGGPRDPAWPTSAARPAPPAVSREGGERWEAWRGAPLPSGELSDDQKDLRPVAAYYFYDDIANHSVLLMQRSLEVVEPSLRQESLYVAPEMKSFGWSYPVKMNFILNAIKANWGKVIVVLDTDLVFYRPWTHLIPNVMRKNDIAFQGVDSYDPASSRELSRMRKSITIAIVAIKCNARSQKLFEMVLDRITCNGRWVRGKIDQDELVSAVTAAAAQGMRWGILPRHFWGPAMSRSRCKMPAQPVMCHPDKKKGEQGGQWHPWHRKTEWKFHHIISQACMGKHLIPKEERKRWWHPYTLISSVSTLTTPRSSPVDPEAALYIYSRFLPDDWSRYVLQITLKALEPSLGSQFTNGSLNVKHVADALSVRPPGSVTFFMQSTAVVFAPFRARAESLVTEQQPVASAADDIIVVRSTQKVREALATAAMQSGGSSVAESIASAVGVRLRPLPRRLFHRASDPTNATADALLCVSDSLARYSFPWWNTTNGAKGYLTDDERHFWLLTYSQCGRPYTDPYHSLAMWTPPAGEPVYTCGGAQQQRRPSGSAAYRRLETRRARAEMMGQLPQRN
eukprot:TRINITY_DN25659_c0_g1_i1.p1 TRINITY_DN25659_c0_g1~~TRINITY_DN25659_c0_g1_i1.p1  ORF type:complete len:662 (+),score=174.63 TRINITY_DN25659_c0_g1_i1:67-2052(+)